MKKLFERFPDALIRVGMVFVALAGVVLLVRALLPSALTDTALQRKATVEREMARPVRFAGAAACAECHEEAVLKRVGNHRNLSCETCHGTGTAHAENPADVKPALPRLREACVRCHAFNPSRPTGFPQINATAHNPMKQCVACHNPHNPKTPTPPQECQACHAEIARTKALSPHVLLECTTCHAVPAGHKTVPHVVTASIPTERAFCGKCHGKDSPTKETPKVDLLTHGEKYLCWQCHYPHMPEVR